MLDEPRPLPGIAGFYVSVRVNPIIEHFRSRPGGLRWASGPKTSSYLLLSVSTSSGSSTRCCVRAKATAETEW